MDKKQRQAKALRALTVTDSMTEAAQLAGITRRTLYTYLGDPDFQERLEKAFDSAITEQVNDSFSQRKEAEKVLSELMHDESPEIRLRAAKAVIENSRKREESMLSMFGKWKSEREKDFFASFP